MCVGHPDLLICKFGAIGALSFLTIVIRHYLTSLHHETWNHSLKHSIAIVHVATKLTRAKSFEVFHGARQLLLKEFHNNPSFLIALLALLSNLDIHVHLCVIHAELWHRMIDYRFCVTIQCRLENFSCSHSHIFIRGLLSLHHLLFANLKMLSKFFIFGFHVECMSAVSKCLSIVA